MALRPLGDRIIVRREATDEKTTGGLFLPENAKKKPQRGTVISVGPGRMNDEGIRTPLQVKAGDTVLFTAWAGDEFKDKKNKDDLLVMHESDVLAVVG